MAYNINSHYPSYACAVDLHLELVKVKPVPSLLWIQVVVKVPGRKPKTVESQIGSQQQARRALLIGHAGVAPLPTPVWIRKKKLAQIERNRTEDGDRWRLLPHHVNGLGVSCEAKRVATRGRPKVYRHDYREWAGHPGPDLHPLPERERMREMHVVSGNTLYTTMYV